MMEKFKSRKFLMCLAAALASIGASIAGLCSQNETIATVGIVCTIVSSAIYAFCEAWVDSSSAKANTTHIESVSSDKEG